ncbi:hypothetical protein OPV22_030497 [Ensete ventricosum]|uniref:Uncharacterized protein n=1 Tax=Ensete ventricosum TaxID=4639 RepID=A0AAV8QG32_ENSVE|nr:hypothetical protein OPV22_030497 [Ensete ventricosum]RWV95953.1 hypothetical protein GW17_00041374 [Ensete ventricosum]RWW47456.1 hypothetical protein BHE74_00046547 [Ensete ventricosum]
MGNGSSDLVDATKRRKTRKGSPFLDIWKRSLRRQNHQQQQNNRSTVPNPSPRHKFPQSTTHPPSAVTRRNPNLTPNPEQDEDEDEGEGASCGKPKEKKLKLVLRLRIRRLGPKRRKIDYGDRDKEVLI